MVRWWFLVCAILALKSLDVASYRTKRNEYATDLFEECESHQECKNLKYTEYRNGYCQCLPNYFHRKNKHHACYGGINATCDSNNDCNDNDQVGCISNICQSYETFFSSSNTEVIKIYRAEKIGSRCGTDENCSDLDKSQCRAGKCKCVRGYWLDRNICRPVTNVICADDSECEERGTKCILERCVLPEDFFDESNAHNSNLYAAINYGDICGTDHHCRNINNTQCIDGVCECGRGTVTLEKKIVFCINRSYKPKCKQVLNVYCEDDYQCTDYDQAKCFFNDCSIAEDFFTPANAHNVSLYAATYLGDVCRTDHHCRNLENTHCFENECRCQKAFAQIHDKCYKMSDVNCTHDSTCKKYGHDYWCLLNACHQESIYFDTADIHQWRAKWVEGYCRIDLNCQDQPNTRCFSNKCQCTYGYKYESGECKEQAPDHCSRRHPCRGQNKKCILGLCQTPDKFFESLSAETLNSYAAKDYRDVCRTDHHCRNLDSSICSNGKCIFTFDLKLHSDVPKPIVTNCTTDSDCWRIKTFCFLNTCRTSDDFFNTSTIDEFNAYAANKQFGQCRSDNHCHNLQNTHCLKKKCNCLPEYEYVEGICQKAINVTCTDDSECLLPRSYCFINTCFYPEDFLALANGYNISQYATKHINGFCQTDHHCREIEHSKCYHRRCICKNKHSSKHSSNGGTCLENTGST